MNIGDNPELEKVVEGINDLKAFVINYVGNKLKPENEEVTVEMIVQVMAEDFPEFLLAVAEENWIRGYQQAFVDMEAHDKEPKETESQEDEDE
jgi:glucan biosynthesis protein